ncbi:hypothetical protein BRCON_2444 [Candidatus Sumerlaea chitinivorans]|uniref:Uncharacterized protein n=1 Tax=Sumerlaea chitinivorans TaxID=2250252 RepID=A0A2Z4Y7J1_SUMC1|nr:hypothetical protein BRCON_2444 [Candidatus Sumerlaea chitinivorans]
MRGLERRDAKFAWSSCASPLLSEVGSSANHLRRVNGRVRELLLLSADGRELRIACQA